MKSSIIQKTLTLVRRAGVFRPRDLASHGIPRQYLQILHNQGKIQRVSRGLYMLTGAQPTEYHSYAQACKRVPHGVICLLSALRFHGLTTQSPFQIWMAIHATARRPKEDALNFRIVRSSGKSLSAGIEHHTLEGVPVKMYNPAKTVVDCFKFRNKIGMDVAQEAIRDYWRKNMGSMNDLFKYAKICRVEKIIRPYMESLI